MPWVRRPHLVIKDPKDQFLALVPRRTSKCLGNYANTSDSQPHHPALATFLVGLSKGREGTLATHPSEQTLARCPVCQYTDLQPQPGQVQAKGFSPVCRRRCALRWLLLVYILLQPGKVHLCILMSSAAGFLGNF